LLLQSLVAVIATMVAAPHQAVVAKPLLLLLPHQRQLPLLRLKQRLLLPVVKLLAVTKQPLLLTQLTQLAQKKQPQPQQWHRLLQ
jgi:hypothetical protein